MIDTTDIQTFKSAINQAKTVFLTAHVGPDGDTLGSMMALMHAFTENFSHFSRVDAVITGDVPDVYKFMPGTQQVQDLETATHLLPQYDLAICVDCGSADRLGPAMPYFVGANQSLNIDHHISNSRFGKINIIDAEAGASGEVVADLFKANNIPISANAATCLYVAILTDTGGFKFSSTSAKIFDWVAELTRRGANPENIYRHVYEVMPKAQVMLQAHAVEQAQFREHEHLAWTLVPYQMLTDFGAKEEHIEGLVDTLRRIDTVMIAAIIRETKRGHTKVSLRSDVQDINVADIAGRWGGGGHKMASGFTTEKSFAEVEEELIPILEETIRANLAISAGQK